MARLIPAVADPNCASPGELEIFKLLAEDKDTSDWIALHSLDLANHRSQVSGEIDFVVIVPQMGVLCLEIKACRHLQRDERGMWFYGRTSTKGDPRGPFRQAANACHSLRSRTQMQSSQFNGVLFWSAVIFPYLDFQLTSSEWLEWQAVDRRQFSKRPISEICVSLLRKAREHIETKTAFRLDENRPTPSDCANLARLWRPDFEICESSKARSAREDCELAHYTSIQVEALDLMSDNARVLCTGPAGTGKSLLALEAARRACLKRERTLLLCFNRNLADYLQMKVAAWARKPDVRTLHKHLLDVVGRAPHDGESSRFWETILPENACDLLLEDRIDWLYDSLIVDEAQDLCSDSYLDFMDLSLVGGLRTGKWMFFGDFTQQMIYNSTSSAQNLEERASFARLALVDNCRNTPRIGAYATLLGGLEPEYRKYRRPDDFSEPEVFIFETDDSQRQQLQLSIEVLRGRGYRPNDIVVLSFRKHGIASKCTKIGKERLAPFGKHEKTDIPFCTVHAFKGLEAKCVILTDIYYQRTQECESLFYVGATRALFHLHCFISSASKEAILKTLKKSN